MIVILLNTFNTSYYLNKSKVLLEKMKAQLHSLVDIEVQYIQVCGGCHKDQIVSTSDTHIITIVENISDHNAYIGFEKHLSSFVSDKFMNATYIYIHDTCILSPYFSECMKKLDNFCFTDSCQWVFAHTFGLYNMGICTYAFMVHRATDFKNVTHLPKEEGICLEQGNTIIVNDKTIPPLLHYSIYTLNNIITSSSDEIEDNLHSVDMYSINGIKKNDESPRFLCYIASFGVYKHYHSKYTFNIPIWANKLNNMNTMEDFNSIKMQSISNLKTSFVPLISYFS